MEKTLVLSLKLLNLVQRVFLILSIVIARDLDFILMENGESVGLMLAYV